MGTKDITGQRFGKLVAVERCGTAVGRQSVWRLTCDCGNVTEKPMGGIASGRVRSCGCMKGAGGRKPLSVGEVQEKLNGREIVMTTYGGKSGARSTFQCTVEGCGHIWTTGAHHVVGSEQSGCPSCAGLLSVSESEAIKRLEGRRIALVSYGGGILKPSVFSCTVEGCGYVWTTVLSSVTGSAMTGCSRCSGRESIDFEAAAERLDGRPIELLEYGGITNSMAKFRCLNSGCGHEWLTQYTNVDRGDGGTGCPACAGYGFNPARHAVFYIYDIRYSDKQYVGFGISNNFVKRDSSHTREFTKVGATATLLHTYKTKGSVAKEFEQVIKKNFPIVDTGIPGFRTEAMLYDEDMLALIRQGAEHAERI